MKITLYLLHEEGEYAEEFPMAYTCKSEAIQEATSRVTRKIAELGYSNFPFTPSVYPNGYDTRWSIRIPGYRNDFECWVSKQEIEIAQNN